MKLISSILILVFFTVVACQDNIKVSQKDGEEISEEKEKESLKEILKKRNIKNEGDIKKIRARLEDEPLPSPLERVARFFLDFSDGSDSTSYSSSQGFTLPGFGDSGGNTNLFNLNIDAAAVKRGIFSPEQVAIQVGQNALNFGFTTLGWIIAGAIYGASQGTFARSEGDSYATSIQDDNFINEILYSKDSLSSSQFFQPHQRLAKATSSSTSANVDSNYKMPKSFLYSDRIPQPSRKTPSLVYKSKVINKKSLPTLLTKQPKSGVPKMQDLSVEQIQTLLNTEEKAQTGIFDNMTDEEKLQMYSKAKMKLTKNQEQFNRRVGYDPVNKDGFDSEESVKPNIRFVPKNSKPKNTIKRRRKLMRKPKKTIMQ